MQARIFWRLLKAMFPTKPICNTQKLICQKQLKAKSMLLKQGLETL